MTAVALIDTSVLCEILGVPGKSENLADFRRQLKEKVERGENLLLPMATIIETGNHIGRCSADGNVRRAQAEQFVKTVSDALDGQAPFTPMRSIDPIVLRAWLRTFPDWVQRTDERGKGSGLADLSIQHEWQHTCDLNTGRRVYIWSKDAHLLSYHRPPEI